MQSFLKQTIGRFESTYNDRIVPLEQLKIVSDMYAVNIVDAVHKTRDGAISTKEALESITKANEYIASNWRQYLTTTLTDDEVRLVDIANEKMKVANISIDRLVAMLSDGNVYDLINFAGNELYPAIDPVSGAISELVDLQLSVAKTDLDASVAAYNQTLGIFITLGCIALSIGAFLSTAIIRQLTRELGGEPSDVADIARAISAGSLNSAISLRPGDTSSIIASCKSMQDRIREIVGNIIEVSNQLSTAGNQLAASSVQLSSGSERQSNSTATMAAAVEQLTVSINQVFESAKESDNLARDSNALSQTGAHVINDASGGMLAVVGRVQETAAEITRLGSESENISNVVQVIKDVADQTNLLALNAAIEAARAGEQGRGFAVVADEVRKLAERTTKATVEISQLIAGVQNSAQSAVASMHQVVREVEAGSSHATVAGQSINEITRMSEKVMHVVQDISSALAEQSIACGDIAKNVEIVAQMAEENGAATGEVAQSAVALAEVTRRLEKVVGEFHL